MKFCDLYVQEILQVFLPLPPTPLFFLKHVKPFLAIFMHIHVKSVNVLFRFHYYRFHILIADCVSEAFYLFMRSGQDQSQTLRRKCILLLDPQKLSRFDDGQ